VTDRNSTGRQSWWSGWFAREPAPEAPARTPGLPEERPSRVADSALAVRLTDLALDLGRRGDLDGAEPLLRRSLEIHEGPLAGRHPHYLQCLDGLYWLANKRGDVGACEPLITRALQVRRRAGGVGLARYADGLNNVALFKARRGDLTAAESLLRQAAELWRDAPDAPPLDYATCLNNLAVLSQRRGDLVGAEPLFRQALQIRRDALGDRHPDFAASLICLGSLLKKQGQFAWAKVYYRDALAVHRSSQGGRDPGYAVALIGMAEVYWAEGRWDLSAPLIREALAFHRKTLGPLHPDVATDMSILAGLCRKRGQFWRAEVLIRRALKIRRVTLGDRHPYYANSLNGLALILDRRGDPVGADKLLRQALEIRREVLGEDHPDYKRSLRYAATRVLKSGEFDIPDFLRQGGPFALQFAPDPPGPPAPVPALSLAAADLPTAHADDAAPSGRLTMILTGQEISNERAALTAVFDDLGARMLHAARRIQEAGTPPAADLLTAMTSALRLFEDLRDQVIETAASASIVCPAPDDLGALDDLGPVIDAIVASEESRERREAERNEAVAVLERVLSLSYKGHEEFAPLVECQANARGLLAAVEDVPAEVTHPEVASLAEGSHPLAALLTMVERRDDLDDDTWGTLLEAVTATLGKSLAAAAARARIIAPPAPSPATTRGRAGLVPPGVSRPSGSGLAPANGAHH